MMRVLREIKSKLKNILIGEFSTSRFWKLRQKSSHSRKPLKYIYSLLYSRYLLKYGASIPNNSEMSSCPCFPHGITGIFISGASKIGSNCTIFHQVTIGSNTLEGSKNRGAPVIGDNVFIGCGAKIIGGVHIGNNVCIGANCVVTRDVPDDCTVVMPHFRTITRKGKNPPAFMGITEYIQSQKSESEDVKS